MSIVATNPVFPNSENANPEFPPPREQVSVFLFQCVPSPASKKLSVIIIVIIFMNGSDSLL